MSQKIVITANMNRSAGTAVPEVTYQWHWRRIVTVALLVGLALIVFAYSLMGSVNAEQNDSATDEPAQFISAFEVIEEEDNESLIAQHDAQASEPLDSPQAPVTVIDNDTTVEAVPEISLQANSSQDEAVIEEPEPIEQNLEVAQANASQDNFAATAHIASVALGAKIDTDKVSRAVLTRDVVEREPVNVFKADIRFSEFTESLAFFSELKNLQGQQIRHIWRYENQVMASIELNVTSPRYRTYSNKHILPEQTGQWRVDVVDEQDHLLAQKEFRILAD
ncbi:MULTISPECIES: DUF2914 domain-containing protein [unclassified Pseudoalteromonas]|uniref:DUF2914 domain-containing protein n=1 Tax=unclassified Pseudoalteromonas TaxID=194690 RepID=UPI0025B32A6B|nr:MULTISPECIES: DUF2914 domain-containing protein [unclassified Pseudoalteromonas]MDN3378819.1 DUF2914 domain-containing protein [Pseudoalteromonas sp. APC 3893]MDN3387307.1 DUF2914 domain-containing protein [Pseudoalteromonas sp. APC 4017]